MRTSRPSITTTSSPVRLGGMTSNHSTLGASYRNDPLDWVGPGRRRLQLVPSALRPSCGLLLLFRARFDRVDIRRSVDRSLSETEWAALGSPTPEGGLGAVYSGVLDFRPVLLAQMLALLPPDGACSRDSHTVRGKRFPAAPIQEES